MAILQTNQNVGVDEVRQKLSDALGSAYRVTAVSDSTLKVGRTGVIPSRVTVSHANGGTTFKVQTSGLIVSRLVQAASINPRVRRALADAYTSTPAA
jgi:hypothetical protein